MRDAAQLADLWPFPRQARTEPTQRTLGEMMPDALAPLGARGHNRRSLTILDAMHDPALFGPWFQGRESWRAWEAFLAALFGLPMDAHADAVFRRHTGRTTPPTAPTREAWVCVGVRGGKSNITALVAVYLACFRHYRAYLAPGERARVMVLAGDRDQARVVFDYVRAFLTVPALHALVVRETQGLIELRNGVVIEIRTSSFRSVRGYTCAAVICDEIAFWQSDESSANPDVEIIKALRPRMATIPSAMLIAISSPYARRGVLWEAYRKHYGQDGSPVLVWQAPTLAMNPTIDPALIAAEYEKDEASAAAEYGAEFRRDVESFINREAVDACVVPDRRELPPVSDLQYVAFVDPSGGSQDAMTLAIGHRRDGKVILDAIRERRPPFSPAAVVEEFAATLKAYRVGTVTGDRYAGEWPRERFREHGIEYRVSQKVRSDLYRDLLPLLNSGQVELLDHQRLIGQLCSLERRTARGGKDSIDHAPGAHDDVANAAAGALVTVAAQREVLCAAPIVFERPSPWRIHLDPTPSSWMLK